MRLIDVDVLRADYGMAEDCKDCKTGYRSCEYDRIYSKMDFCGWLDDAPTVDAVPVRRGKWIRIPQEEMFCCDQCGRRGLSFEEVDVYGYTHDPFCADCGARMDGNHHEG